MKVLIVGFGTVGRGLARLVQGRKDIRVVGICDKDGSVVNPEGVDLAKALETGKNRAWGSMPGFVEKGAPELIPGLEFDVLAEMTPTNLGTGEPGLSHIRSALEHGRHVVTSNKGPLVVAFDELGKLAQRNRAKFLYEATVGGGLPVFNFHRNCLMGYEVKRMFGIVNGTTNFILTRMSEDGASFAEALRRAQNLGYAEKEPSYDTEGTDAAAKAAILSSAILKRKAGLKDVSCSGITKITPEAIALAKGRGYDIKLVADIGETVSVAPRLVKRDSPLCVHGTLNAITFVTEPAGDITLVGKGAGGNETAAAVLNDILEAGRSGS